MYSSEDNLENFEVSPAKEDITQEDLTNEDIGEKGAEAICESEKEAETPQNSKPSVNKANTNVKKHSFHLLSSVITFVLLPHFWCLSIPAIIFAGESKKFFLRGNLSLSRYFADKAKKFVVASWLVTAIVAFLVIIFSLIIGLSLI